MAGETLNHFLLTQILEWKDNLFDRTCCPKEGQSLKALTDFNYCWKASLYITECIVKRSHKCDLKLHLLWAHLQLSGQHSSPFIQRWNVTWRCSFSGNIYNTRCTTHVKSSWQSDLTLHSVETSTLLRLTSVHDINKYHENLEWHCTKCVNVYNTPAHIVYHMKYVHEHMTWPCT